MMVRQFSRIRLWCLVVGVVSTQTVWGQVQQPLVTRTTRNVRIARANLTAVGTTSFYNAEIRGVDNGPDDVLLEHPSNPKSMTRRTSTAGYAIVQAAQKSGDIPTQHLFDDSPIGVKKSTEAVADEVIPRPPGSEESVLPIEPIAADDAEPTPATPTAKATTQATESVPQATEVIASQPTYTNPWPIEVQATSDQVGPIEVEAYPSQGATNQGSAAQGSVIQKSTPVAHGCS